MGPGSLAFMRPKDETSIHDFLARGEEKHHSPSSAAAAAAAAAGAGAASPTDVGAGAEGSEAREQRPEKRHRGLVGAGAAYEPKRCAEVVAAKYAQLAADDAVQMDKALAVL